MKMKESKNTADLHEGLSEDQKAFEDAEYMAWVDEQIRQGREDLKDPAKRHSEKAVWKALGLKD